MADNIANILMRIRGDDDDGDRTLKSFLGKLKAFGQEKATATADVEVKGEDKLARASAALSAFNKQKEQARKDVTAKVDLQIKAAAARLELLKAKIQALNTTQIPDTSAQKNKLLADLEKAQVVLDTLKRSHPEVLVSANIKQLEAAIKIAEAKVKNLENTTRKTPQGEATRLLNLDKANADLDKLQARLGVLRTQDPELVVKADIRVAEAKIISLQAALDALPDEKSIRIKVEAQLAKAEAELVVLQAQADALDHKKITIEAKFDKDNGLVNVEQAAGLGAQALGKFASVLGQVQGFAGKAGSAIGGVTANLGPFGVKLTPAVAGILALVIAMGISLVAAAGLMVTALAGAAAAVGLLAVAFIGALGPAVALAIATFTKITSILKILKAQKEANAAADRKTAEGTAAANAAEERRHNSLVALSSALRGVASAERAKDQAVQAAKDAITQASRDEVTATESLVTATQDTKDQLVAAYKAIIQSAQDARKALLAFEEAKLGIQDAALATKEAELALKSFRSESGLAGKEFDNLFKKFTNVDANVDVSPFLSKLIPGAGGTEQSAALQLEKLILSVQHAKLGEKEATETLKSSESDLTDKRKESAKFLREGVLAYKPYTDAIKAQRDATVRLADATDKSNELERQGVANNPGVLNAVDALVNANDRLKEARHDAAAAAKDAGASDAAKKAQADWDNLSDRQQQFGLALQKTIDAVKGFFGPAVDGVLTGLTSILGGIPGMLNPLKGAFTQLGNIIGQVFAGFGKTLSNPAVTQAFIQLIRGAGQLAKILGGQAFPAFMGIMLQLATATMPFLVKGAQKFAGWLQKLATNSGPSKLKGTLDVVFGLLTGLWGLVKAVGRVFLAFFTGTAGASKGFLKTLTDMTNTFADFLGSKRGQAELKKFFEDVIPLAVQTIKLIANVVGIVLKVVQILAPALTGLIASLNFIGSIIGVILSVLRPFLQVAVQIALLFGVGLPKAVLTFVSKFGFLKGLATLFGKTFFGIVTTVVGRLGFLAGVIPGLFGKITQFIIGWVSNIGHFLADIPKHLRNAFLDAVHFIEGLNDRFFKAGRALVSSIVKGVLSLPGKVAGGIVKIFGKAVDLLPGSEPKNKSSPLAGLQKRGKAIIENLASGIPHGASALSSALHSSLVPVVAGIDANVSIPRPRSTGSSVGTQYNGPYIAQQDIRMPESATNTDTQTQAELLAAELRKRGRG